jgi:hypothetical protein
MIKNLGLINMQQCCQRARTQIENDPMVAGCPICVCCCVSQPSASFGITAYCLSSQGESFEEHKDALCGSFWGGLCSGIVTGVLSTAAVYCYFRSECEMPRCCDRGSESESKASERQSLLRASAPVSLAKNTEGEASTSGGRHLKRPATAPAGLRSLTASAWRSNLGGASHRITASLELPAINGSINR